MQGTEESAVALAGALYAQLRDHGDANAFRITHAVLQYDPLLQLGGGLQAGVLTPPPQPSKCRAARRYLVLKNLRDANTLMAHVLQLYALDHGAPAANAVLPAPDGGAPVTLTPVPLLNFCQLLLRTVERTAPQSFTQLRSAYQQQLQLNPNFTAVRARLAHVLDATGDATAWLTSGFAMPLALCRRQLLDRVGEQYAGIRPAQPQGNLFSNLLRSMFAGPGAGEDDE